MNITRFCNEQTLHSYLLLSRLEKELFFLEAQKILNQEVPGNYVMAHRFANFYYLEFNPILPVPLGFQKHVKPQYRNDPQLVKFLNSHFKIIPNDPNGDCFFHTIRDAYLSIHRFIPVQVLRDLLANVIPEDIYRTYKSMWDDYILSTQQEQKQGILLIQQGKDIIKNRKNIINSPTGIYKDIDIKYKSPLALPVEKALTANRSKINIESLRDSISKLMESRAYLMFLPHTLVGTLGPEYIKLKPWNIRMENICSLHLALTALAKIKMAQELKKKKVLMDISHIRFMSDIHSFEEFKEYIKSKSYWADELAIAMMERLLDIKFIIIKKKQGQYFFYCNDIDQTLVDTHNIQPVFYIMIFNSEMHYELISYESQRIFTFQTLPELVKDRYLQSCLTVPVGNFLSSYYRIIDFLKYRFPKLSPEEKLKLYTISKSYPPFPFIKNIQEEFLKNKQ
jgi:hypothetical protein